ncbi:MAG: 4Fe-4S dicluster domain-containing protein [Candidatus Dormibacteraeota bacterium]|nr:4Fe-4S dicluster domain-containing protein [Candidatus Dormibacteraeota bacterium]
MSQEPTGPDQGKQSRRSALKVFGAVGVAGTAALLGAKVRGLSARARAAVPKSRPRTISHRAVLDGSTVVPAIVAPTVLPPPVDPSQEDVILVMEEDVRRALAKPEAKRQWGMTIDLDLCTGCQACTIACINEWKLPPGVVYRPVLETVSGTYPNISKQFLPKPCFHCEEPPCVPVCPVAATFRRPDGIVAIDYDVCIGCRYCITACPYSARTFDWGEFYGDLVLGPPTPYEEVPSLEYGKVWERAQGRSPINNTRKCQFCIERVERGELPACTRSCMGRATYFGDLNDPQALVNRVRQGRKIYQPKQDLGTNPHVYYLL